MLRLKELRMGKKLRQEDIAKIIGIAQSTYSSWENGKIQMDYDSLATLSNFYNVSADYILGISDEEREDVIKKAMIPVLGKPSVKLPAENVDEVVDFELIPPDLAVTGEYFGVIVKGNSMAPRILSGDLLIVHIQNKCESGDIAVISLLDDRAVVRRVQNDKHGIILFALNTGYKPMFVSNNEIVKYKLKIIGKVVEFRAKI